MKIILSIFLVLSLFRCFSQDSIVSKKIEIIEFKNNLDQLTQDDTYKSTKKLLGSPDSSNYVWESFDFGGPRIFRHFWTAYYGQINAEIQFTKTTGRRMIKVWRPIRNSSKMLSITIISGSILIDNNFLTIGDNVNEDVKNMLQDYSIVNSNSNFMDIVEKTLKLEFYFDKDNKLEKITVFP